MRSRCAHERCVHTSSAARLLQDDHMHALLHGQAVSSSSMEMYGDKDSDSGEVTPKYTGGAIWQDGELVAVCVGRTSQVTQCAA